MKPALTIYRTSNGWVLEYPWWDDGGESMALQNVDDDDVDLLWSIAEQLCDLGSRYDAARLFIGREPGDKHHDLHPSPCADCRCRCKPDRSTAMSPSDAELVIDAPR